MVDIRKAYNFFSTYFNSKKLLEEDLGKIYLTKDINFLTSCMEDVYKSLKEVSDYSFFGRSGLLYEFLREKCLDCEDLLDSVYILNRNQILFMMKILMKQDLWNLLIPMKKF